jgi:hypothetical protein
MSADDVHSFWLPFLKKIHKKVFDCFYEITYLLCKKNPSSTLFWKLVLAFCLSPVALKVVPNAASGPVNCYENQP